MRKITLGAIAVTLALSTALPVDIPNTGGLFGAPPAQAGMWGSIKGAAGKVGGAAKRVGKEAAAIGKHSGKTALGIGKAAGIQAGRFGKQTFESIGYGVDYPLGVALYETGSAIGRGLERAHDAVLDEFKDRFVGKAPAEPIGKPLPKPGAGKPGSWGGKAGKTAMVRRVAPPNNGFSRNDLGIARDKSALGRPVGMRVRKDDGPRTKDFRPVSNVKQETVKLEKGGRKFEFGRKHRR